MRFFSQGKLITMSLLAILSAGCTKNKTSESDLFFNLCTYNNKIECEDSWYRCFWGEAANTEGRQCFDKDSCDNRSETDCKTSDGCVFNNDGAKSYCLSKRTSACDMATIKSACTEIWECVWSDTGKENSAGQIQHCFGTLPIPSFLGGYACSDYPQDICAMTGCIFDESGAKCLSRSTGSCTEFTTEANCSSAGCLWNSAQQKCLSTNPLTTRCGDFTAYGKDTCEEAGCLFDDKATPNICASKFVACADYEPSLDSCPISFGCRLSENGQKCESENCNFNVTQTDCNAQPGCNWDTYCRNP